MEVFYQATYFRVYAILFIIGGILYTVGLYEFKNDDWMSKSFYGKYTHIIGGIIIGALYYVFPDVISLVWRNSNDFIFVYKAMAFSMNLYSLFAVYLIVWGIILVTIRRFQ